ncbi:MAG: hypothetical protein WBG34_13480 [Flavobacteriales bacterium]
MLQPDLSLARRIADEWANLDAEAELPLPTGIINRAILSGSILLQREKLGLPGSNRCPEDRAQAFSKQATPIRASRAMERRRALHYLNHQQKKLRHIHYMM